MVFGLYGLSFVKHYLPQNDTVVIPDTVYKMIAGTASHAVAYIAAVPIATAVAVSGCTAARHCL